MKSIKLLLSCCIFFLAYSCSDSKEDVLPPDDNSNVEAEKQINEVIKVVNDDKELSSFAKALSGIDAKKLADNEFTILAYKNKKATRAVAAKSDMQQDETLRHIIGGHYTFDALKKLQHLIAQSKDTLYIKYSEAENLISINGVSLGKSMLAGKNIIFVTDSIIPQAKDSAVVKEKEYQFRVLNINANWSIDNAKEDAGVAENALITIYENEKAVKELRTDNTGLARFSYKEDAELDYVVKTDTSSMFYQGYLVKGLFTSQEEIDQYPLQKEFKSIPGGLKFADINGDGQIDNNDKIDRDALVNLSRDTTIYLVGKSYTYPKEEIETVTIDMAYDAYDEAEDIFLELDNQYSTLNGRQTLSPSSHIVEKMWHRGYEAIRKINIVMDYDTTDAEDKLELESFRANLHLWLSLMFGDVPLQLTTKTENMARNSQQEVYDFASQSYSRIFEQTSAHVKYKSDAHLNNMLINRLLSDYSKLYAKAKEAIESETITLPSDSTYARVNDVRVYLLMCEAANEVGKIDEATHYMNLLLSAEGIPSLVGTTTESLRAVIRAFYDGEKYDGIPCNYGIIYNNITSWSLNSAWDKYKLLPIPNSALTAFGGNSLLTQNAGW